MNLVLVLVRNLIILLVRDHVESLAKSHGYAAGNTDLAPFLSSPLLRLADVADMGVLPNLLVSMGGWLHGAWRCELVLTYRLFDMVAKSRVRDKVAGLPEGGDPTAADGAGKLCSVAHDDGFDGCLCEMLIFLKMNGEVRVRSCGW